MLTAPAPFKGTHLELDDRLSQLVKELSRKDAEARDLRIDLQFLEEAEALNLPSDHPGGPRMKVPEDEGRDLAQARNHLKSAYRAKLLAQKEKNDHSDRLAKVAAKTDNMRHELTLMQDAACWKPGDAYGYIDRVAIDNEVEGWRRVIWELLDEQATEQRDLHIQMKQLSELAKELQSVSTVDEDLFNAETELKTIKEQIRLAQEEIVTMQRIFQRKEKMVEHLEGHKLDAKTLRALENEKRLAASKLSKHRDFMRQNDVLIRNQAIKIQKYEDKLELIGEAIRGDDGDEVDRVDVDILLDVQKEIQQLKTVASRQSQDIVSMDEKLEAAESCLRAMVHQRRVTQRRIEKATETHKTQVRLMDHQAKEALVNAQTMLVEQRLKIDRCGTQSRQLSARNSARRQRDEEERRELEELQKSEVARKERLKQSRKSQPPPKKAAPKKSDSKQPADEPKKKEEPKKHQDPEPKKEEKEPATESEGQKQEEEEPKKPAEDEKKEEDAPKKSDAFNALDIIDSVTQDGIEEVLNQESPEKEVSLVFDGILIVLGEQWHSWDEAKAVMREESTLPQLRRVRESLTKGELDVIMNSLRSFLDNATLPSTDADSTAPPAVVSLTKWLNSLLPYHEEAKEARVEKADEEEPKEQEDDKEATTTIEPGESASNRGDEGTSPLEQTTNDDDDDDGNPPFVPSSDDETGSDHAAAAPSSEPTKDSEEKEPASAAPTSSSEAPADEKQPESTEQKESEATEEKQPPATETTTTTDPEPQDESTDAPPASDVTASPKE